MTENIGIIKISEKAEKYVQAISAKLHLQIEGENFFFGNAAFERSTEIKSLVEILKEIGIGSENILIKDVSLQTDTGIFNKTSKATYKIAVQVQDLGLMSKTIGAVAGQKNCQLTLTEWIFDEDEARIDLAREALVKAKHKADSMAEAVGYKIIGIKECSDIFKEIPKHLIGASEPQPARMRIIEIGADFQNENKVSAEVFVEFLIEKNQ